MAKGDQTKLFNTVKQIKTQLRIQSIDILLEPQYLTKTDHTTEDVHENNNKIPNEIFDKAIQRDSLRQKGKVKTKVTIIL